MPVGLDPLFTAYVRLRPHADPGEFESEGKAQLGAAVGRIAENAALVFASKKIFDVGRAGIAELGQAQVVNAATQTAIENLGGATDVTAEHVDKLGQKMLDLAGFDDEAARSAANVLLGFQSIGSSAAVLDRTVQDSADLAVKKFGGDIPAAAQVLGKALEDPAKAARLLRSANIILTDSQQEAIKSFVATGDKAAAQGVIFDAVEGKVKGAAAAYGDTLPGQLKKAQENLTNVKAALVTGVAPALGYAADATSFLSEKFQEQPEILQSVEGGLLLVGGGLGALVRPASDVLKLLDGLKVRRDAHAAATDVDTVTTDANTIAVGANAVATDAEAVALEGEAVAAETAAAANAGFLASLGPIAIAAAAVGIAIAGISQKGEQVSVDLHRFASASDTELLKVYNGVRTAFGGAELGDFIDKLKNGGSEGVGALKRLRDLIAATGGDTSQLDQALAGAATAQKNLTSTTQEGNTALGNTSGLDAQAAAAKRLTDDLQASKAKLQSLADLASGAPGSDLAAQRAALGVQDAKQREADAQTKLNEARKGGDPAKIAQAERDLNRAQIDTKQSVLDAADASVKFQEAQDALNGKLDDAKDKAVLTHDSLAFLAQGLGTQGAADLQPFIDQLQKVIDLENEQANLNAPAWAPETRRAPSTTVRNFAAGGDLEPGAHGMVGEYGPEPWSWPIGGKPHITPSTGQRTSRGSVTTINVVQNIVAPTPVAAATMSAARLRRMAATRAR